MNSSSTPRAIAEVAKDLGIRKEHLVLYGDDKAKIRLDAGDTGGRQSRLVLVSAITPTGAGEGKTTISIGLAQGLAKIGRKVCLALREPSLGPTFGVKGGATGGGRSTLVPAEDIDLHFTGDFHAVSTAHNLLAALLDNHIHHGNSLEIDARRVFWRRVIDLNDRALRHVVIGLGGVLEGVPRETGFDITPASEIMAALCLAESAEELKMRLSRLLVALDYQKNPVTAKDLQAVGALMVVLKDALMPNLVQTGEGAPALVHGGPFANIAHGCNSVLATKMALAHADWVVTEAGFGFELGAEKFFDIKCVSAGLDTAAVVLVVTIRALKYHGGVKESDIHSPNPRAVEQGLSNLEKHIENIRTFCEPPVVCLNRFQSDTTEEIAVVKNACDAMGVPFAVATVYDRGGEGGVELAEAVLAHAEASSKPFQPLYDWSEPIKDKMQKIAGLMYGARGVSYTREAERDLRLIERLGYGNLPLCVAKTPASLSGDPRVAGRPKDFDVTVRSLILSAAAGYVVPLVGDIIRMPGLPSSPRALRTDLVEGRIRGLLD